MRQLIIQPAADRDLNEISAYLGQGQRDVGRKLLRSAQDAFQQLLKMPGLGEIVETGNLQLAGLRCWRVPRFKNYIIFYRPTELGIEVLRVLHGARDIETALGDADVPE